MNVRHDQAMARTTRTSGRATGRRNGPVRWAEAEVGADDRTVIVRFNATFDEDSLAPELSAELSPDVITLALRLEPVAPGGGVWVTTHREGPPDHEVTLVLPEPVAGRDLADAWRPPPPPPSFAGPWSSGVSSVRSRGVVSCSSTPSICTTSAPTSTTGCAPVSATATTIGPAGTCSTGASPPRTTWAPNTRLRAARTAATKTSCTGSRDIFPAPPPGARTLTIVVYDDMAFDTPVGRVAIRLDAEPA